MRKIKFIAVTIKIYYNHPLVKRVTIENLFNNESLLKLVSGSEKSFRVLIYSYKWLLTYDSFPFNSIVIRDRLSQEERVIK